MSGSTTRPTAVNPRDFVAGVGHPVRRADAETLLALMEEVTGQPPVMWGPSIVGFGSYHYRYPTGREGDAAAVGFSPRSASLSLYGLTYGPDAPALLARFGRHKVGAACLYVNKLSDVDPGVLRELIDRGYRHVMSDLHSPAGSPRRAH